MCYVVRFFAITMAKNVTNTAANPAEAAHEKRPFLR